MNEGPMLGRPLVRWGLAALVLVGIVGTIAFYRQSEEEPTPTPARKEARAVSGWALPQSDRDNTRSADSNIKASSVDELEVAWRQELSPVAGERGLDAPPLIVDEAVYVQDAGSNVWGYNLRTGDELWRRMLREKSVGPNGLAYENGRVFSATPTDAFSLDADNGTVEWRTRIIEGSVGPRRPSLGISMAPMVVDERLVLADSGAQGGGVLVSMDTSSGEELWRAANPIDGARDSRRVGGVLGTPLVTKKDAVHVGVSGAPSAGSTDALPGALRSFSGEKGMLAWTYDPLPLQRFRQPGPEPIEGTIPSPKQQPDFGPGIDLNLAPARVELEDEDAIVTGGSDGVIRVVTADDGTQLWSSWVGSGGPLTQFAVADGVIYVAASSASTDKSETRSSELAAFDAETGEQRWQLAIPATSLSAVTATNDLVLVADSTGKLHAVAAKDGKLLRSIDTGVDNPTGVSVTGDHVVLGATAQNESAGSGATADSVLPVVVVLQLGATSELEPELSVDADDEVDEVSDKPATNPVPKPPTPAPTPPTDPSPDPDPGPAPDPEPDPEPDPDPDNPAATPDALKVSVASGELRFTPEKIEVEPGVTTFQFTNPHDKTHDFTILDEDGNKVAGTGPLFNAFTYLEVDLATGSYTFVSTEHAADGMVGKITVADSVA